MADRDSFAHVRMLLIDNYDSFTYNLVQAFAAMGANVKVYRNDAITVEESRALEPTHLVISPGPGRPEDAGVSLEMIGAYAGKVPILGDIPIIGSLFRSDSRNKVRTELMVMLTPYVMTSPAAAIPDPAPHSAWQPPTSAEKVASLAMNTPMIPAASKAAATVSPNRAATGSSFT